MKDSFKSIAKYFYYKIPYTWRIPRVYYKTLRVITGEDDTQKIADWQLLKLKGIIRHAYENVPGYHQLYKEAGITPDDIQQLADIKNLPMVDKELMRDNIKDFTSINSPRNKYLVRTSGSSGVPFGFYKTKEEEWIEQAFVTKAWSNGGWNINQSGVMLRGGYAGDEMHICKKCDNGSFYVHNQSYMLSPNFLTEEHYEEYRSFLKNHHNISYLFALPSSASVLSQLLIQHHDEGLSSVSAIYLSSESIFDWQYHYIKKAFPNATIISLYGQTERVIMAYWCSKSQKYHIDPYYGLTELLNNNKDVTTLGEKGELIGTSFWNITTPFIRYRTKDYATKGESSCAHCGLNYNIINTIDGRLQDVLVSSTGRYISIGTFDGSLENSQLFNGIIKFKIVQKQKGIIDMLVQTDSTFTHERKELFEKKIRDYLGDDFIFQTIIVNNIEPGANGKLNSIEQHLSIDFRSRTIS